MKHESREPDSGQNAVLPDDAAVGASQPQLQPRFLRLPRSGELCWFSGLSRSQMWLAVKAGHVRSHSLKRPGTRRGVRLVDAASLVEWLSSNPPAEISEARTQKGGAA